MFRTFGRCVYCKSNLYGLNGGGNNIFKAVNLLTNWLKIPKSVNVTNFPDEQLLSTQCTWPKCVVTPKTKFWSMVVPGRDPVVLLWAWWVSLALSRSLNCASFSVRIPVQSYVLSANDTVTSSVMFFL